MQSKPSHLNEHSQINFTTVNSDDHLITRLSRNECAFCNFFHLRIPYLYEVQGSVVMAI